MEVVPAQDSHVDGIVEAWEEFAIFHEDKDPRYPMVDNVRTGFEGYLRGLMAAEDTLVLVAVEEENVVGYSIAQIRNSSPAFQREKFGFIDSMAVLSTCRRQGIGTLMLERIMDWFRSENIDMIELTVAIANQVGYPFWKKHGFKPYLHHLYLKT